MLKDFLIYIGSIIILILVLYYTDADQNLLRALNIGYFAPTLHFFYLHRKMTEKRIILLFRSVFCLGSVGLIIADIVLL